MSLYQTKIKELSPASDPRHIEAYMRLAHGTLDHLAPEQFRVEVTLAVSPKAAATQPRCSHNPTGYSASVFPYRSRVETRP